MRSFQLPVAVFVVSLMLGACGGGGGGGSAATGQLVLGLTDGPVEGAERVVIEFTGLQLKQSGGPALDPIPFESESCDGDSPAGTCRLNLLDFTQGDRDVVFSGNIPAGDYEWVRLLVNADRDTIDSYIQVDDTGEMCPIWIPSSDQNGLRVVSGFTVTANGVTDYTLDFDVRSSITMPPGLAFDPDGDLCPDNFLMKPVIRIVDNTEVGSIAGSVSTDLLDDAASCEPDPNSQLYDDAVVYVFEDRTGNSDYDGQPLPDDIDPDGVDDDPITTASVVYDSLTDSYGYEVGFLLAPEDYLLALTCTAAFDMPEVEDLPVEEGQEQVFGFIATREVTTVVGDTVDGSFEQAP